MQTPSFVGVKGFGPDAGTVRKISMQGPSHRLTAVFRPIAEVRFQNSHVSADAFSTMLICVCGEAPNINRRP